MDILDALRIEVAKTRGYSVYYDGHGTGLYPPGKGAIIGSSGHIFRPSESNSLGGCQGDITLEKMLYWHGPPYATDIKAAMELVDEIELTNPTLLWRPGTFGPKELAKWRGFVFDIELHDNDGTLISGKAKTRAEAICKAYLQWKVKQGTYPTPTHSAR